MALSFNAKSITYTMFLLNHEFHVRGGHMKLIFAFYQLTSQVILFAKYF